MARYGKRCFRCGSYYVAESLAERICPWCADVVAGKGESSLVPRPEVLETLEL